MNSVKLLVEGREYLLADGLITIGRSDDNVIVLQDESVSGHHAEITKKDGSFTIRDLGSTNGTFLNGVRIEESALNEGNSVGFGTLQAAIIAPQLSSELHDSAPAPTELTPPKSENVGPPPLPVSGARVQPLSPKTKAFWWPLTTWGSIALAFVLTLCFLTLVWQSLIAAFWVTELIYFIVLGSRYGLSFIRGQRTPGIQKHRPLWHRPAFIGICLVLPFILGMRILDFALSHLIHSAIHSNFDIRVCGAVVDSVLKEAVDAMNKGDSPSAALQNAISKLYAYQSSSEFEGCPANVREAYINCVTQIELWKSEADNMPNSSDAAVIYAIGHILAGQNDAGFIQLNDQWVARIKAVQEARGHLRAAIQTSL